MTFLEWIWKEVMECKIMMKQFEEELKMKKS